MKNIIIEEAGEESAPSSPNPHGAASNPDGSEKSQENGWGTSTTLKYQESGA